MRDAFHDDLDAIGQSLVEMSELVSKAMLRATKAILEADLALAEEVISEDERIDSLHHDLDSRTLNLMALFIIQEMGDVAQKIINKTTGIITSRDTLAAIELEKDDDEMDKLHRKLFEILLDDNWAHGIETAIDMTLIGRYYERCADHAVSVARRVYFLVTGTYASDIL